MPQTISSRLARAHTFSEPPAIQSQGPPPLSPSPSPLSSSSSSSSSSSYLSSTSPLSSEVSSLAPRIPGTFSPSLAPANAVPLSAAYFLARAPPDNANHTGWATLVEQLRLEPTCPVLLADLRRALCQSFKYPPPPALDRHPSRRVPLTADAIGDDGRFHVRHNRLAWEGESTKREYGVRPTLERAEEVMAQHPHKAKAGWGDGGDGVDLAALRETLDAERAFNAQQVCAARKRKFKAGLMRPVRWVAKVGRKVKGIVKRCGKKEKTGGEEEVAEANETEDDWMYPPGHQKETRLWG
ncbi:hypothetical protein EDC01DRAFT_783115 [Geopyxis carbonaria]|nr:hypothetical protein EDC01DRAFT_783115 [Geopyxis carbonaria]